MKRSRPVPVQRGFAYLWVLLLTAVLGLGLTVGVELYTTSLQRDREQELLSIGRQFRVAIGRYCEARSADGQGKREYPTSLEQLLLDDRGTGVKRHLRKVFVDPMTGKAEWGVVRVAGRIVGVHSLSEKTPMKQDFFEADEAGFRGKVKYSDWVFTYPSDLLLRPDTGIPPVPVGASQAAGSAPSAPGGR